MYTEIFIVYRVGECYDSEENLCGNTFCLVGVFSDPQKAKDAASRHGAEIELRTLNEEKLEWY